MEKWKAEMLSGNLLQRYKSGEFIKMIADAEPIKESDIDIYFKIIEKMIVFEGNKIIITLLDGIE
jgi:site-specific DNA recombinase